MMSALSEAIDFIDMSVESVQKRVRASRSTISADSVNSDRVRIPPALSEFTEAAKKYVTLYEDDETMNEALDRVFFLVTRSSMAKMPENLRVLVSLLRPELFPSLLIAGIDCYESFFKEHFSSEYRPPVILLSSLDDAMRSATDHLELDMLRGAPDDLIIEFIKDYVIGEISSTFTNSPYSPGSR